MISVFLVLMEE